MYQVKTLGLLAGVCSVLINCSGSDSGSAPTPPSPPTGNLFNQSGPQSLTANSLNSSTESVRTVAVTGTVSGNTLQSTSETLSLDTSFSTEYVAVYELQSGTPSTTFGNIGVAGQATPTSEIPTGGATYSGKSNLDIVAAPSGGSSTSYTVTSDVDVTTTNFVDFSLDFDNLDGTKFDGTSTTNVNDIAEISISSVKAGGGNLTGGVTSVTNGTESLPTLSGNNASNLRATIYGPDAAELGGVWILDDGTTTVSGNGLTIRGVFVAEKD